VRFSRQTREAPQVEAKAEAQQDLDVGADPRAETDSVDEKIPEIDPSEVPVELDSLLSPEVSQEISASIEQTPQPIDPYELPVTDLELLLIELDANPFEVQPEKAIQVEQGAEQQ